MIYTFTKRGYYIFEPTNQRFNLNLLSILRAQTILGLLCRAHVTIQELEDLEMRSTEKNKIRGGPRAPKRRETGLLIPHQKWEKVLQGEKIGGSKVRGLSAKQKTHIHKDS